jgi:glucose/arabinose dehydrogenase
MLAWLGATAGCGLLGACGGGVDIAWGGAPAVAPSQPKTQTGPAGAGPQPRVTTFAAGLANPWGLALLPDGRALVTERPGRMRLVGVGGNLSAPIAGLPAVDARGQGGLLDVVIDPDFQHNRRVYFSYAEPGRGIESGLNGTAVARAVLSADAASLGDVQVIFRQTPKVNSTAHFGSRLVFARDGTLFMTLGERFSLRDEAQNLANTLGKVVRIRSDGSVPPDNPFVGRAGASPEIWSLGHRNVQGAAIHPDTGELWTSEHGPRGGDEVNIDRAGGNYGWPRISYGCEYGSPVGNCAPVGGASVAPDMEQPLTTWVPTSIAPSGMLFYTGGMFAQWRGSLFIGALAGQSLWRLRLDGNRVVAREALLRNLGERIRDVRQAHDGSILLLTDSASGRILHLQA